MQFNLKEKNKNNQKHPEVLPLYMLYAQTNISILPASTKNAKNAQQNTKKTAQVENIWKRIS